MTTLNWNCPICYEEYDLETKLPRIFPTCGHTICSYCISNLIQETKTTKCPIDKSPFRSDFNIHKLPVNYSLRALLETRIQTDRCPDHGEEFISFCLTDRTKICVICLEEQHRGHKTRAFKSIAIQAEKQRKALQSLTENIKDTHAKLDSEIKAQKDVQIFQIEDSFKRIRSSLNYKEKQLKSQVNLLSEMKRSQVSNMIGDNSTLFQNLLERELSLRDKSQIDDLLASDDIFDDSETIIEKYKPLTSIHLHKQITNDFKTLDEPFDDFYTDPKTILSQLEIKSDKFLTPFVVTSRLAFEYNGSSLTVRTFSSANKTEIDLGTWQEARRLSFFFEQQVNEKDLAILALIWENLKPGSSLLLKFATGTATNELYQILCGNQKRLRNINLDVTGYRITTRSKLIPLIRDVFLNANNVKKISLTMCDMIVNTQCLSKIFEDGIFDTTKLEEFSLDLRGTKLIEQEIESIFVYMPRLKVYRIYLRNTEITDQTLITCVQNTLVPAQGLEQLTIYALGTQITDVGVEHLCKTLKNLKKLELDLGKTLITNQAIELLSEAMAEENLFNTIESFRLGLSATSITNKGISKLFRPMPNVREFFLSLRNTQVTDKAIRKLIEESLVSMVNLDVLTLRLGRSSISDQGFRKLLMNMKDVKELTLDLKNTLIHDETIKLFLRKRLPQMTRLEKLDIYATGILLWREVNEKIRCVSGQLKKVSGEE